MFEVLEPASAVQVRSVLDQLQRAAPQVRARTRTLILAPGLMGVSGGAVARLIGLCPALETIVCDMHMISSLVRLPPIRRLFLGEAELVVIMRLLAESELEDLRVESLTRTVDGLTIAALEAARAAAFHLRRLEVAFDEIELVASADGTPDVPEGPITQLPTPFEYLCMSAYSLTHLRIAGATARPVSSALRKLRRLTLEKPPRGAGGLRVLEIVVPAEDNVRQFLRELLGFLPDTCVEPAPRAQLTRSASSSSSSSAPSPSGRRARRAYSRPTSSTSCPRCARSRSSATSPSRRPTSVSPTCAQRSPACRRCAIPAASPSSPRCNRDRNVHVHR